METKAFSFTHRTATLEDAVLADGTVRKIHA